MREKGNGKEEKQIGNKDEKNRETNQTLRSPRSEHH